MTVLHLSTTDGFQLPVYSALPPTSAGQPQATLIVLHEAFAVTPHIQHMCQFYAQQGFACLAPDLLARPRNQQQATTGQLNSLWEHLSGSQGMLSLPVNKQGLELARTLINAGTRAENLADIDACMAFFSTEYPTQKQAITGYCFGGSMAYYTAARRPLNACISYYGGMLAEAAAEAQPTCPTLIHLARQDQYIPLEATLAAFARHHPAAEVHVHEADHGFNRDDGITYDAAVAATAHARSLAFLRQHLKMV